MILYLHIGLNKTGSSFIQSVLANNRKYLLDNGIWFPSAGKVDNDMSKWEISPGNGLELCFALLDNNKKNVLQYLESASREAKNYSCEKIIVSNEGLFAALSSKRSLSLLAESCRSTGYRQIKALAYFRDPVSHLMSVYKHRSKTGRNSDFEKWVSEGYETALVMQDFLSVYNQYPVDWTFRKYKKDPGFLLDSTFTEWFGIQSPAYENNNKRVNPSLSLSEIFLIQSMYKVNPYLTSFLYSSFLVLEPDEKADDTCLEREYRWRASLFLEKYMWVFVEINKLLPSEEQLALDIAQPPSGTISASLSRAQLESLVAALVKSTLLRHKVRYLLRNIVIKISLVRKIRG